MDDFLIQYCQKTTNDFIVKTDDLSRKKKGKRVYLNEVQTRELMIQSKKFFESKVDISRKLNDKVEKYLRKSIKKQVNSHRVHSFNF
jgi:hypothetical protein